MEVYAPKLQAGTCTFQRVVLHSCVLQCAIVHNCYPHNLHVCSEKDAWVTGTKVCVVCACLGLSTLKHKLIDLETYGAGKDGTLLEHWLKQGRVYKLI